MINLCSFGYNIGINREEIKIVNDCPPQNPKKNSQNFFYNLTGYSLDGILQIDFINNRVIGSTFNNFLVRFNF